MITFQKSVNYKAHDVQVKVLKGAQAQSDMGTEYALYVTARYNGATVAYDDLPFDEEQDAVDCAERFIVFLESGEADDWLEGAAQDVLY